MDAKKRKTSWGKFAGWYHRMIEERGGYQKEVILPNLLRALNIKKGEAVLDLACGQGFFAREFFKKGARVVGADISAELVGIARKNSPREIKYEIASADDLKIFKNGSVDKITVILAIQNIENPNGVFAECGRILKSAGELFLVMNHPSFRIPKESEWGFDEKNKIQYRRISRYLSEAKAKIQMSPGDRPEEYSLSFHRPLQFYFKALRAAGFCVGGLEEWISNRKSEPGPRAATEDRARKEIPLFLFIRARKAD